MTSQDCLFFSYFEKSKVLQRLCTKDCSFPFLILSAGGFKSGFFMHLGLCDALFLPCQAYEVRHSPKACALDPVAELDLKV